MKIEYVKVYARHKNKTVKPVEICNCVPDEGRINNRQIYRMFKIGREKLGNNFDGIIVNGKDIRMNPYDGVVRIDE